MNNTTLLLLQNTKFELTNDYDSIGAMIMMVIVILWYSSSIVLLLGLQTMAPSEIVADSLRHSKKLFTPHFREKNNNKIILEELGDKEKRNKLWDIYFSETSGDMSNRITHADGLRIRNIQRQLENINKYSRSANGRMHVFNNINSSNFYGRASVPNIVSFGSRVAIRRDLSMDQQMLEEWKTTENSSRRRESRVSVVQKLFVPKYSRRKQSIP